MTPLWKSLAGEWRGEDLPCRDVRGQCFSFKMAMTYARLSGEAEVGKMVKLKVSGARR